MLLAFIMDMVVFIKADRIDIAPEGKIENADTNKELPPENQDEKDLLKLRKLSHDIDEEQHTKLGL